MNTVHTGNVSCQLLVIRPLGNYRRNMEMPRTAHNQSKGQYKGGLHT